MRAVWFIGKFELLLNFTKYPNYSPKSRTPQQPQNVGCNFKKRKTDKYFTMKLLLLTIFNFAISVTYCQDINRLQKRIIFCNVENIDEIRILADSLYRINPVDETATTQLYFSYKYHELYDSISYLFNYLKKKNPNNYLPFLLSAKLQHPTVSQKDTSKILELLTAEKLEPMNTEIKFLLGETYYNMFYQLRSNYYAEASKKYFLTFISLDTKYINSLRYPILQLANFLNDTITINFIKSQNDIYPTDKNHIPLRNISYFPITSFLSLPINWENDYNIDVLRELKMNSNDYYSYQLWRLKEPLLFRQTSKKVYRLSLTDSYQSPVAIRIEKGQFSSNVYWKYYKYNNGNKKTPVKYIQKSKRISNIEWDEFRLIIDSVNFWNMTTRCSENGRNVSSNWLLEGIENNNYHIVECGSLSYYFFRRCGEYLRKLTDLETDHFR